MYLNRIERNKIKFKQDYIKQLSNIEWVKKRTHIKNRDNNKCINCENINDLQVHHTLYFENKKIWDYEDIYLVTLCKNCHQIEHKNYGVGSFKRSVYYTNKILKIDNS